MGLWWSSEIQLLLLIHCYSTIKISTFEDRKRQVQRSDIDHHQQQNFLLSAIQEKTQSGFSNLVSMSPKDVVDIGNKSETTQTPNIFEWNSISISCIKSICCHHSCGRVNGPQKTTKTGRKGANAPAWIMRCSSICPIMTPSARFTSSPDLWPQSWPRRGWWEA